ncbi:MAG: helix-turn-helix transcriptional regulator [Deltaproteobacteria bacterium]|nr:helix-turn-helix transcriptional regulator [Deltaproteobacteria bacterium]
MENITLEDLGKILKQKRKEKGLTQKDVAEATQIDQSIISSWERGTRNPSFLNIHKLCQLLDITIDELLGLEKRKLVTLTVSQENIEKLQSTIKEYEETLRFIFPSQDSALHHKWAEHKRLIELLLLNTE